MGCTVSEEKKVRRENRISEPITRLHHEHLFVVPESRELARGAYPWERDYIGEHPRITKEFFCCNGSSLNPSHSYEGKRLTDCGGLTEHGLPYIQGEEGVYPILPNLLNYLQEKTGKRVVITCGHRCPQHNTYSDPDKFNETSKHMIGGEVDFYIQGMEDQPEEVVDLLLRYFTTPFRRYNKETNVSTEPWYNKEVFIKLFREDEGRDHDNRHPYPYICIQVRYDAGEQVTYTWKKAHYNYRKG